MNAWLRSLSVMAIVLAVSGVAPLAAGAAPTTSAKAPAKSTSARLAEQQRRIAQQQARIDTLERMVAEQRALLQIQSALTDSQTVKFEAQQARIAALENQLHEIKATLDQLNSQAGLPPAESDFEARLKRMEETAGKEPDLPPDVVSAGDFPGSIRIPGTDAAIKFGARIRTAAVFTLDPLGTDDRFLTNSIPVDTTLSGEAKRTNISARASRLNMEFRTPGGLEQVRAFFEGDFAGVGNAFRLRHAYAQYVGFILGQTWSTFSDPYANHLDLDFEGVSAENIIRQPLLRYWWGLEGATRYAVAIETPSVSITGAQGVNLFPDVVARGYYAFKDGGHLQVAGVLRQIRGQSTAGDVHTIWGGGGSASGVILVPIQDLRDRIVFQLNGGVGIARYINDLNSLGGMDAVFDSTSRELKPLPAVGWYVSYEHVWKQWASKMNLRSMAMWSFVTVDNYDFQAPDSYDHTNRFVLNAVVSPSSRVDMGIEFIHGERVNKDGNRGDANQIQLVGLFRF